MKLKIVNIMEKIAGKNRINFIKDNEIALLQAQLNRFKKLRI